MSLQQAVRSGLKTSAASVTSGSTTTTNNNHHHNNNNNHDYTNNDNNKGVAADIFSSSMQHWVPGGAREADAQAKSLSVRTYARTTHVYIYIYIYICIYNIHVFTHDQHLELQRCTASESMRLRIATVHRTSYTGSGWLYRDIK